MVSVPFTAYQTHMFFLIFYQLIQRIVDLKNLCQNLEINQLHYFNNFERESDSLRASLNLRTKAR